MKRALAACVAAVTAIAGMQVAGGGPALAGCERVLFMNPEMTVHEDAGRVVFTVFSGGCAAAGSVSYTITPGTATPGDDFKRVSGTLLWEAGDATWRRIVVPIANDGAAENELEDFTLKLYLPTTDVKLGYGTGHGRILDDDNAVLIGAIDDQICPPVPVGETPPPGQPWLQGEQRYLCDFDDGVIDAIPCRLTGPNTILYGTADGTAEAGRDYLAVTNGQVQVPAGATLVELPIDVLRRPAGTPTRWFYVQILGSPGCTFGDDTATVTILGPAPTSG